MSKLHRVPKKPSPQTLAVN